MSITQFFNGNRLADDLSPVSALRLNFDQLPTETTDTIKPTKNVFGVAVPAQFVPERIISWLDNSNNDGAFNHTNQSDLTPNSTTSDKTLFSNNDLNRPIIKKVDNVRMIDRYNVKNPTIGTLYITATHIIFVDPETNKETWILHMHIGNIEKLQLTTTGSPLLIRCKTFLFVTFVIPREKECHDIYVTLQKLYQPVHIQNLYCFQYTSSNEELPKSTGWDFFSLETEFKRQHVPNDRWTLCNLNKTYELCDTYPRQIYVPTEATTAMLIGSSKFRSKARLPVLTYLHSNQASICRCSQPLSGFSARCLEDEQMLEAIRNTNSNSKFMYVVDTRPRINAMANRAAGKGYENEAFYENIKFHFLGIENIHVMRTSLQKLVETISIDQKSLTMSGFLNSLEASGWLKHVRAVLDTSSFIASAVDKGISVVVHCSDGWDRTAQVCSLAALMCDPFYRTIKGFQALIEKDWLGFGHKFSDRCGHIQTDPKEMSPVFTQFLDCTFQLMQQRNDAFEFNERFLLILHDHVQSCQFGTFIGNCEKDRLDLRLSELTFSLWGYMANHLNEYVNPLYRPEINSIIRPNLSPQSIKFWRGMYGRFESGVHPRESMNDLLLASQDHTNSLEDHVQHLTKRIGYLKNLISKSAKRFQNASKPKSHPNDESDNSTDNKYAFEYDKKMSELSCADEDHPLKQAESLPPKPDTDAGVEGTNQVSDKVTKELDSVAVDWKSLRTATACSCTTPFDQFSRKSNCWRCGEVYCVRCINNTIELPGHDSNKTAPVCRNCFRLVQQNNSP
ncbi:myotubularin-related protein 6 isoform X3 [Contarinia nasturtii]|uniref:myotubularin-related protein 6 isoform X3 n=1 Tax=Contarinia nasturtii TaxID=265458 RepID=UPI0012D4A14C|nr:myotubularin-related protein 6 isoform X3 [Contarinia nasturtii]